MHRASRLAYTSLNILKEHTGSSVAHEDFSHDHGELEPQGAHVEMYCTGALYITVAVTLNLRFHDNFNKITA